MMNDPRRILALAAALFLSVIGYITTHHLFSRHPLSIDVSDGRGHGPDYGTGEWKSSVDSIIHSRSVIAGVAVGLLTFAAALRIIPPSESD